MPEIKSILQSTKKKCGYDPEEEDEFDADLIDAINSSIHGPEETWEDFLGSDKRITMAKTYVFDRARLIFDANGLTSSVINMINERIKEFEWRLTVALESPKSFPKGG